MCRSQLSYCLFVAAQVFGFWHLIGTVVSYITTLNLVHGTHLDRIKASLGPMLTVGLWPSWSDLAGWGSKVPACLCVMIFPATLGGNGPLKVAVLLQNSHQEEH